MNGIEICKVQDGPELRIFGKYDLIELAEKKGYGYKYIGPNDDGSIMFQKVVFDGWPYKDRRYAVIRVLPSDLVNGNFEFMCEHDLSNTNKIKRSK